MKVYKGALEKDTIALIENSKDTLTRLLSVGLGKVARQTYTIEESIAKYNSGITTEEIQAWVWYRKGKGIPMNNWKKYTITVSEKLLQDWIQNGILFFNPINSELEPFPVFVFGNIYERLAKLKEKKQEITEMFGAAAYEAHKKVLETNKPKPLSIINPITSERPIILAISAFARKFKVEELKPDTGVILDNEVSLRNAYASWLITLTEDKIKGTTAYKIVTYYLNNKRKPRDILKEEWGDIQKVVRDEGERLFKIFLHEALSYEDQLKIDAHYNSRYNAIAPLQHHKIPIGLEISRKFKGFDLELNAAQREGIAFMELVGSGIIAYDVGVGKTITAISETVMAIRNGKCKRPLVVVPNPTYQNWINEMLGVHGKQGVLTGTDITVNQWYNLGTDYDDLDLTKKVPESSITLITYEGLMKIGFKTQTQEKHFSELVKILQQAETQTERQKASSHEKIREIIGVGLKGTQADIEDLGFDYLVIDEGHNYKNIFASVKGDAKYGKQFHITGGTPSDRGIKAFFLCNYIQREYGRNVMLLSATPFTNSPMEIYSMLSLVAYKYMRSWGILNIRDFFEQYIQETTDFAVAPDGELKMKNIIKSFNNRVSLQKLINSHINFKTGEEANIPRPCKINLPKTTVTNNGKVIELPKDQQLITYLSMTEKQQEIQNTINEEAAEGFTKDDPSRMLRLINMSLGNAISHYLVVEDQPTDYVDFIDHAPKIKYAIKCIASVKKWHEQRNEPVSGQAIYLDRGKEYFHFIKEYLEKIVGFKKDISLKSNARKKVDEVEILTGDISNSRKEKIKQAFNEGTCKVIIGTSTMKEGSNLQERATCLYNCYPNWNPTDLIQVTGRFWRQGNKYGYVRIAMPLMENSMDVFVFQKYEEKAARINDLWSVSNRTNVIAQDTLDPDKVKYSLITDLDVLFRFEKKKITNALMRDEVITLNRLKNVKEYNSIKDKYFEFKQTNLEDIEQVNAKLPSIIFFKTYSKFYYYGELATIDTSELPNYAQEKLERIHKLRDLLVRIDKGEQKDTLIIKALTSYYKLNELRSMPYFLTRYKDLSSKYHKMKYSLFKSRGFSEDTDLQLIETGLKSELEQIQKELKESETEAFQEAIYEQIIKDKQKYAVKGGSLSSRVKDFASLNHLLSYKFEDIDHKSCVIPTKENPKRQDTNKKVKIIKIKAKALRLRLKLAV